MLERNVREFIQKAMDNIESLTNEVQKGKKECAEQESLLNLARTHGSSLQQKQDQMLEQYDLALQQNKKLRAARDELQREVAAGCRELKRLNKLKVAAKQKRSHAVAPKAGKATARSSKYEATLADLEDKKKKQRELQTVLEEKILAQSEEIAALEQQKESIAEEYTKRNQALTHEVALLSQVLT